MNTVSITIKTDAEVKKAAEKKAERLGVSLSSVLDAKLREFVTTKWYDLDPNILDEIPNARTQKFLKQSEKDEKAGRVSPSFSTVKDAIAWLDDPSATYENGDKVRDEI